jgi:cytochrome c oxidase subunit 2
VTSLILVGLLVLDVSTTRALATPPAGAPLSIEIVGHQWWWEVHYPDPTPSRAVTTANEVHIPVGRPVQVRLESRDVIHSFWVPNLQGKRDLIPGHVNTVWLQADQPGLFHGQCAEFCGAQHAHMAFLIVAEPESAFSAWLDGQRQPAASPATDDQARGQEAFLSRTCALCHTVRGANAWGQNGPDLTHLATRRELAAGTLPNRHGSLVEWVTDPHRVKPGTKMPPMPPETGIQALVAYLESLK